MTSATITDQMFLIPAYPFWSLTIIAADVALWRLCVCGGRQNLAEPSMPRPRRQRAAI